MSNLGKAMNNLEEAYRNALARSYLARKDQQKKAKAKEIRLCAEFVLISGLFLAAVIMATM